MKYALITDTHYGARQDSIIFADYYKKFFETVFFPYIKSNNIETVFHLGDLVDRRTTININTAKRLREDFLNPLRNFQCYFIAGNHDCAYNNTNQINIFNEIVNHYGYNIFIDPTVIAVDDVNILLLPWICRDNIETSTRMIQDTRAQVCFGHLQIQGFEMYRGQYCENGLDMKMFDKFDLVATGHFHHKSHKNNIHYLGAATQQTWHDYSDPRGFHIFDTETRSLEFIPNPYEMFHKVVYDDTNSDFENVIAWDFEKFRDTYVKIIVQNKTNPYWFDLFFSKMEEVALDVKKTEERVFLQGDMIDDTEVEDTIFILKKTINELPDAVDKKRLEPFMVQLYNEAQKVEL